MVYTIMLSNRHGYIFRSDVRATAGDACAQENEHKLNRAVVGPYFSYVPKKS